jgi:site-specific recombinase XerD
MGELAWVKDEVIDVDVVSAPLVPALADDALERLSWRLGHRSLLAPGRRLLGRLPAALVSRLLRRSQGLVPLVRFVGRSSVGRSAPLRRHLGVRHLSQVDQPTTGRPASPASIARRLSCPLKFYDDGVRDAEVLDHSPVANARRPKVSDDSATVGLTADELDKFAVGCRGPWASVRGARDPLVYNGLRIAEALACDVESVTYQRGYRVLRIVREGGKASTEPLSLIVLRALEDYAGERTTGPLFVNAEGNERVSYSIAYKLIRRLARRAGIAAAGKISPHSLRHSFATL